MVREQASEFLPIIKAFAEGKTIQVKITDDEWIDIENPLFSGSPDEYRIKPESTSNPLKSKSEEEFFSSVINHPAFELVNYITEEYAYICGFMTNI